VAPPDGPCRPVPNLPIWLIGRGPNLEGCTALVGDDHDDALYVLTTYLESCRARVFGAHDPDEALQVMAHTTPDIILTDLHMPHESGAQFLYWLRNEAPEPLRRVRATRPPARVHCLVRQADRLRQSVRDGGRARPAQSPAVAGPIDRWATRWMAVDTVVRCAAVLEADRAKRTTENTRRGALPPPTDDEAAEIRLGDGRHAAAPRPREFRRRLHPGMRCGYPLNKGAARLETHSISQREACRAQILAAEDFRGDGDDSCRATVRVAHHLRRVDTPFVNSLTTE
jgi:CheY-like chemotaxis protein